MTTAPAKVCLVVHRTVDGNLELLAFRHPSAGNQFVKGTIAPNEDVQAAALRELREESGLTTTSATRYLGPDLIGNPAALWHFYAIEDDTLPQNWDYRTEDDFGHVFSFFWHPITQDLDQQWHAIFHEALESIRRTI